MCVIDEKKITEANYDEGLIEEDEVEMVTMVKESVPFVDNVKNVESVQGFAGLFGGSDKLISCTKNSKRTTQSPLSETMEQKKTNLDDENDDTFDLSLEEGENFN